MFTMMGLEKPHSSFTVCTLWYAEALAWRGELAEATRVLNSVLCRANHVGLLSEDIDPRTGTLWGELPSDIFSCGNHSLCACNGESSG